MVWVINMKLEKNSLITKIWLYLIVFSIAIISFLWLFQVIFLDSFYEYMKLKDISKISNQIIEKYKDENFIDVMDLITYNKGVCIEVVSDANALYSSNSPSRGCMGDVGKNITYQNIKRAFINDNNNQASYKIINEQFNNKVLVHGIKLENNLFVFINVSLEPLNSVTNILVIQLIYVTIIVLLLSLVIAYFISKKVSKPIIEINEAAKDLSKGKYEVNFKTKEDIREINELVTTLNYTSGELAKTESLRREFLANVSHDLKTPLTMIKAYAEMVRDLTYNDSKKRNKNLKTIIEETDRLNLLVNDILDLSKMQSNTVELNIATFDLNAVINNIMKKFDYLKDREKYLFEYKNKKELIVDADIKRIEQVLYNLIGNAINFIGDDKKIVIKVTDNYETYHVEVIDHGQGINEEDLPLIWDKYYKTDKKYKRNDIGTGVGLSIVKNILTKHNFNYGVSSIENEGTIFYFDIKKSK